MKLSQTSAVFALLCISSAQAFVPPKSAGLKKSNQLFLFNRGWSSVQEDVYSSSVIGSRPEPILADVEEYDFIPNRGYAVRNEGQPHEVSLEEGFGGAVFLAYQKLLVEVAQKADELLTAIEARKTERMEQAAEDYERQLANATKRAEKDLTRVAARNTKHMDRAMDAYEQQLAALTSNKVDLSVQNDQAGMADYEAQLATAIQKTEHDLATVVQKRTSYMDKAMAAYEKQLLAATRKAEEELASAQAKKDKWIDGAMATYEKQLLAATKKAGMNSDQEDAGMQDYEAQMNAAVWKAREVASDWENKVGQVFRTGDYHASLSRNTLGGPSSVVEPEQYKGMLAYQEQLEAAVRKAEQAKYSLEKEAGKLFQLDEHHTSLLMNSNLEKEASKLFQLDDYHTSLLRKGNDQPPRMETIHPNAGFSVEEDEAGMAAYEKQLNQCRVQTRHQDFASVEEDEAGMSDYEKQLTSTAARSVSFPGTTAPIEDDRAARMRRNYLGL